MASSRGFIYARAPNVAKKLPLLAPDTHKRMDKQRLKSGRKSLSTCLQPLE